LALNPETFSNLNLTRSWILQEMRYFRNYYYYKTNNPECEELIEKIINRYDLNIGLDMHQKIYLVDDNFVAVIIKISQSKEKLD
jgi:hypothetical protein